MGTQQGRDELVAQSEGSLESQVLTVDEMIGLDLGEDEEPNEEVAAIVEYMGRLTT